MIKYFAVRDASPKGFKIVAVADGLRPRGAFQEIPLDDNDSPEVLDWLTKVADPTPEDPTRERVVVDRNLKRDLLRARRDARQAERDARQAERDQLRALGQFFRGFDKNELVTREDIQDAIENIVRAIRILNKS